MTEPTSETRRPFDSILNWVDDMPIDVQPYLRLSRFDRPVGFWLLAIPCWAGLALARIGEGFQAIDIAYAILFGVGAIAMRGAGCTYNDILDRDLDAQVARTAQRPLPSGAVSLRDAWLWLIFQVGIGFLVWLALPVSAKVVALVAIPLVALYPVMKRITWWPQAWLGATFNFGILVALFSASEFGPAGIVLYLGFIAWTIGYDTIYALQDIEDDALIGVRSTARLFGDRTDLAVTGFYGLAAASVAVSGWIAGGGNLAALTALIFLLQLTWQITRLRWSKHRDALQVFKSNQWAGLIVVIGFTLAAIAG